MLSPRLWRDRTAAGGFSRLIQPDPTRQGREDHLGTARPTRNDPGPCRPASYRTAAVAGAWHVDHPSERGARTGAGRPWVRRGIRTAGFHHLPAHVRDGARRLRHLRTVLSQSGYRVVLGCPSTHRHTPHCGLEPDHRSVKRRRHQQIRLARPRRRPGAQAVRPARRVSGAKAGPLHQHAADGSQYGQFRL